MRSATAAVPDLTAQARIREAAIGLFAARGVAGTSLRAVARAAGVSPALVVHHFGSKEGLTKAVDRAVVAALTGRLGEVPLDGPDLLERRGAALAELVQAEPLLCDYIARTLAEGAQASNDLFDRLFVATRKDDALVDAGTIRADTDPDWRALQQLILVIGPLMLRPQVERALGEPLDVERWMRAIVDLLRNGLYAD